jgi:hypothetical protein
MVNGQIGQQAYTFHHMYPKIAFIHNLHNMVRAIYLSFLRLSGGSLSPLHTSVFPHSALLNFARMKMAGVAVLQILHAWTVVHTVKK